MADGDRGNAEFRPDLATRKPVWKAEVSLTPGSVFSDDTPGDVLAADVLKQMRQDGIFRSCPPQAT